MLYLTTYDTIYDEGQERLGCEIVWDVVSAERPYRLLRASRPFPHFEMTHADQPTFVKDKGRFGERMPSEFLLVTPRHKGFSFADMEKKPLHVHLCIPKYECYPPDDKSVDLKRYVHVYWALLYASLDQEG